MSEAAAPGMDNMGYDVIFVGGGLSAGLGALSLLAKHPEAAVAIVERESTLGGNHTWCFHAADVGPQSADWLEPLIVQRWPGYSVRFPARMRRLASPYACVTSARLHAHVSEQVLASKTSALLLSASAHEVSAQRVLLADGRELNGKVVIDARGPELPDRARGTGYQKFLGLELEVEPDHDLREPVLMDACVRQHDGFRFMYLLPLSPTRILLEDTFFSDHAELDESAIEPAILAYARAQGFKVRNVLRRERGVLPMPWSAPLPVIGAGIIQAGYRGGFFHPVTGYSFPLAVRFAEALTLGSTGELARAPLERLAHAHSEQLRFLFVLTRLMFTCFESEQRFRVLEHFYRLPESVIERFYAAELRHVDRARLFWGAPPRGMSLRRALGLGQEATP